MISTEQYLSNRGGYAYEYTPTLKVIPIEDVHELMKIYAKQVAEQALKDAADSCFEPEDIRLEHAFLVRETEIKLH